MKKFINAKTPTKWNCLLLLLLLLQGGVITAMADDDAATQKTILTAATYNKASAAYTEVVDGVRYYFVLDTARYANVYYPTHYAQGVLQHPLVAVPDKATLTSGMIMSLPATASITTATSPPAASRAPYLSHRVCGTTDASHFCREAKEEGRKNKEDREHPLFYFLTTIAINDPLTDNNINVELTDD